MSSVKERITKKAHSDPRVNIDTLHSEIIKNLDDSDKSEYYLDNGVLLNDYYSNTPSVSNNTNKGILSYFNDSTTKNETTQNLNTISEYMENIDDRYIQDTEMDILHNCKLCNSHMLYNMVNSDLICNKCGYTENIIINSEKSGYKDPPREVSYFAYKRINHFNEWLAQFQAKETTEISEEIYNNIFNEIKKNKNIDVKEITHKQMRDLLKKLEYNKFYEHIPHIINVLNGRQAPVLSLNKEEHLRALFKEIQLPFTKNCPEDRKNFLSYSYVLHKICELLEYDYLLPHFPLLKSREKLLQQDKIWKCICHDLNWQYIPSI